MKQIIRLTESDLHKLVKRSVNNIIREMDFKTPEIRNKMRDAFVNKGEKRSQFEKGSPEYKKADSTMRNVYDYMKKKLRGDFSTTPGSEGVRYDDDMQITSNWEDYIYQEFGEEVYNAFMKWAGKVDFDPTMYGKAEYSADDPSVGYYGGYDGTGYDIDEEDAIKYELAKLDREDCPLTPEQRDELRDSIVIDLFFGELQDERGYDKWEENPSYERPEADDDYYNHGW